MASNYEDTVFDFDLNFLGSTCNNTDHLNFAHQQHKQLKAIKSKIIATGVLINKFYSHKDLLRHSEKNFDDASDKHAKVELMLQTLRKKIQYLDATSNAKYVALENSYEAIKQDLMEKDLNIEALKIEIQLEKNNVKNFEKNASSLKNENNNLMKVIQIISEVTSGKKKLNQENKIILEKYNIIIDDKPWVEPITGRENSCDEADILDDLFMSPASSTEDFSEKNNAQIQTIDKSDINPKDGNTHEENQDYDCNHEFVSLDTGRGSSLAFSDSDKCFHSPDYFINDSPISTEIRGKKDDRRTISVATSPVILSAMIDVSTSPIDFDHCEQPVARSNQKDDLSWSLPTIVIEGVESIDINPTKETTPKKTIRATVHNKINACEINMKEKECLELNNSIYLHNDNTNDPEIQNILSIVRLTHDMITPLPSTPPKTLPSTPSVVTCSSRSSLCNEQIKLVCQDAATFCEKNNGLSANLDLFNEDVDTKEILKRKWHKTSFEHDCQENIESCPEKKFLSNVNSGRENIPRRRTSPILQFQEPPAPFTQNEELFDDHSYDIQDNISPACVQSSSTLNTSLNLLFEEEPELNNVHDRVENELTSRVTDNIKDTTPKNKKLTKLDKIRKKLLPKSKIQRVKTPSFKKLLIKPKQILPYRKKVLNSDSSASLNDKDVYEKAVKFMSELNKQKFEKAINGRDSDFNTNNLSKCTSMQAKGADGSISCEETKSNRVSSSSSESSVTTRRRASTRAKGGDGNNTSREETGSHRVNSSSSQSSVTIRRRTSTRAIGADGTKIYCEVESHHENSSPIKSSITTRRRAATQAKGADAINILSEEVKSRCDKRSPLKSSITTRTRASTQVKCANDNNISCEEVESHRLNYSSSKNSINTKRRSSTQAKGSDNVPCDDLKSQDVNPSYLKSSITTRSRSKRASYGNDEEENIDDSHMQKKNELNITKNDVQETRMKRPKRASVEKPESECKRILRSSTAAANQDINENILCGKRQLSVIIEKMEIVEAIQNLTTRRNIENQHNKIKFYNDESPKEPKCQKRDLSVEQNPQESALLNMIEKYGVFYIKTTSKNFPDSVINSYHKSIEEAIAQIIELPSNDVNKAMNELVERIKRWPPGHFVAGLIKYLMDPARKVELFSKVCMPPAPPMTKSEQVLLYILMKLKKCWLDIDIVDCVLSKIEYTLFRLNRTPEFDIIESMSHFYAVLCRYIEAKSRLRIFILDAMYCIQFKAVSLIKQCLDVWMQILPLAHMGVAKSPLVTCLVYLLHFFKCEDKFNRVQTLRNIMRHKFFYEITEWNDSKILEMFRTSIMELRDIPIEEKMLRSALILLAKRQGARWCQNNIIKNLLQPMIEKERVPEKVKVFCVSMMGPLLKPYPVDMKVHCEIVMNQLIDMLDGNPTQPRQEAILKSLIYMSKHNQNKIIQLLLSWTPKNMSPDIEKMLKHYVREKPVKVWKNILSKMSPMDGVYKNMLERHPPHEG